MAGAAAVAAGAAAPTPPSAQPHSQALDILLLLGQLEQRHLSGPAQRGVPQQRVGARQANPAAGKAWQGLFATLLTHVRRCLQLWSRAGSLLGYLS